MDLSEEILNKTASTYPVLIVWFYAPWCKQCKIVRDAYETAATDGVEGVTFARLDCVRYPETKLAQSVFSYPSFKVFRGPSASRWLDLPKARTPAMILSAARSEAAGPFTWLSSAEEVAEALFQQMESLNVSANEEMAYVAGWGEVLVLALLSSNSPSSMPAEQQYAQLAAGASLKLSPMSFVAVASDNRQALDPLRDSLGVSDAELREMIPDDHVVVVKLYAESGAGEEQQRVPRLATRSLLAPRDDERGASEQLSGGRRGESLRSWLLGNRLPLLIDFGADFYWPKRAAQLAHIKLHLLLFVTEDEGGEALLSRVFAALSRLQRGQAVCFFWRLRSESLDGAIADGSPLFARYDVHTIHDAPKLALLDQRLPMERRKQFYTGEISTEGVLDFVVAQGGIDEIAEISPAVAKASEREVGGSEAAVKEELVAVKEEL